MKINEQRRLHSSRIAQAAVILACIMWALAVVLPIWEVRSDVNGKWSVVPGALPAFIGWLGILVKCPAWFANFLLIPPCLGLLRGQHRGFWWSVIAVAIAASAYMMPAIYGDNEKDLIVARKIGFYLWLGAFVVVLLGYTLQLTKTERPSAPVRWLVVTAVILGLVGLEYNFPVGVSPLEAALKNPDDSAAFTNALARNPSQAEKDAALPWLILQYIHGSHQHRIGKLEQIEKLVAEGASVNQTDRYGTTLLMQAVYACHRDEPLVGAAALVKMLVRAGANVNARDYRDKTVLDIATEIGASEQCRKILSDAGAR